VKRSGRKCLAAGMLSLGLAALFVLAAPVDESGPRTGLNAGQRPAPYPLPCNGPDLAATQMSVKAENYNGQWWVVTRAQITNKGTMDYSGKVGQAVVQLTCKRSWDPTHPITMDSYNITHLAKGSFQNVQGSFQLPQFLRAGCAPPLKPTECCRDVQIILKIVFDPDIRSDGNPANDDCNPNNNTYPDTPETRLKYTTSCLKLK
jgi:hypothetical protein